MDVGLRVVRGPDWKWQNQDGGEGHVGTVVEVGRTGNSNTPEKTVVVQWDSGFRTNYRVGYQGDYDLLVWDSSPTGVKHPNVACDSCKQQGILGIRWKCSHCPDYDLCHSCYMSGKHDLNHAFCRFDTPTTITGVKVSKRANATQLEAKGIFPEAIVVRGPDWDWGNQDGGPGKHGKVLEIRGWDSESGQSVANVQWDTGSTNVYRLGHKGKVDIKYISEASGGFYYREHLPKLGESSETASSVPLAAAIFKVGDKVRVDLEVDVLRVMQEGHGGWNPKMADCIKKVGAVHRITDRGDVRVQFETVGSTCQRWTFHSGALTKVPQFDVGDYVKISDDVTSVKQLQRGHGEWTENMKTVLGKLGKVVKIYPDEDMRIKINGQLWTFNPKCCMLVPNGQQELNNTLGGGNDRIDDHRGLGMQAVLQELLTVGILPSGDGECSSLRTVGDGAAVAGAFLAVVDAPDRLVREAAQGHASAVNDIIVRLPHMVNSKSSGKTALQVACHQGHLDVVQILLDAEADLKIRDEDGDTALHYSAFGDQPEILTLLLQKGAFINSVNIGGCTALHVAVNKQHVRCIEVLLKRGCDVNIQDVYGDTALHDAVGKVGKDSKAITELLIQYPDLDFLLKNKRGFNVLHHASLKGNVHATELILKKCQLVVDVQKDDGFAALHLSSLNGHIQTTSALLNVGKGNIDIKNSRRQTPLLLAMSQGHAAIVELLVLKGADVQAKDEDGQTCLHLALLRQAPPSQLDDAPEIQKIHSEVTAQLANPPALSLACFLLAHGLDMDKVRLSDCAQCIRLVTENPLILHMLSRYQSPRPSGGTGECLVCSETAANVLFLPCKHQIACILCSSRMKKCLQCQSTILQKIGPGGIRVEKQNAHFLETKRLTELQQKLEKVEESQTCAICMENKWNVAFLCGHSACTKCAESLRVCHMCRKTIENKINLFT